MDTDLLQNNSINANLFNHNLLQNTKYIDGILHKIQDTFIVYKTLCVCLTYRQMLGYMFDLVLCLCMLYFLIKFVFSFIADVLEGHVKRNGNVSLKQKQFY